MRILAIETVGMTGSVAALEYDRPLAELQLNPKLRSAQSLAPGIQQVLSRAGWPPRKVELVAVANGPGSFTGLRIGVTTAKTFAYAAGCKTIGVNTLLAIASRVSTEVEQVTSVLDAGRGELFVGDFRRDGAGDLIGVEATKVLARADWLATLHPGQLVTGPALTDLTLPAGVIAADRSLWVARAADVGRIGWRLALAGTAQDSFHLLPHYFLRTAAERQWERRTEQ